ncbi:MAG: 3-oxoacyl-[acyl-carrier-protein] synthase 3 protein 1 [Candidatus Anoxychlamydiales bacterium]|nr:3-oxoacyl-[acyl-carrier-protein] synthase 3 protein 1 [Candidatus Anoxychlamydiales bacterium]NGX52929.1 3-oxoacyl-[acyl-carrier-protein] synthase 3 protein 1 [Candidatus Anoxychlamydiales bacterium]
MAKAKIIGLGSYYPKKVLTNKDFEKMLETSDEWIRTRTGVEERRIAAEGECASDMGAIAANEALKDANLNGSNIDFILVATSTPDYIFPSTACLIQEKIKANNSAALDVQAACSGFIYAITLAKSLVETKAYKNILVVASEKLSSIVDYEDRNTAVLFGDAATACVVSLDGKGLEIKTTFLAASGKEADLLILPAGGSKYPASLKTVNERKHYIQMNGKEVYKHAVRRMKEAIEKCLEDANLTEKDISWLIPHQANERIIDAIAKRFKHLENDKIFKEVVHKFGNTSASSVGLALDILKKQNRIKPKEKILLTVFGAGFTWGACILENN